MKLRAEGLGEEYNERKTGLFKEKDNVKGNKIRQEDEKENGEKLKTDNRQPARKVGEEGEISKF